MERVIQLMSGNRMVGEFAWNSLPLNEAAILARSRELFRHANPCSRQLRIIRTALLLELEREIQKNTGRVTQLWQRYVNGPACDRVRFGQR